MHDDRIGQTAVIFMLQRNADDDFGYAEAAAAMDALAARQPGYHGMESVRASNGMGITVSYWADDDSAKAWRDHPDHKTIRDAGRGRWYERYEIAVATVHRSYDWTRA